VQLVNVGTPFLGQQDMLFGRFTLAVAGIYVCCTALRLARFNIELTKPQEKHHASFAGLPSPGAAGTVASLVLLQQHFLAHRDPAHWTIEVSSYAMVAITLLVAIAMVSRLRYAHVANRFFRGRARFNTIVWVVIVVLLLGTYPQASLAFAGVTYALSAPVAWVWQNVVKRRKPPVESAES
jgi:CDP-diacylglycerol--serine O-phosphatidyltransferase